MEVALGDVGPVAAPRVDAHGPRRVHERRVRREQTEVAKAAVCGVCGAGFPSKSKLFAHLRCSACGAGAVAGAAEPTTFLCVYAAYADGATATAALLARFGAADAEFRAWAVPPCAETKSSTRLQCERIRMF